MKRCHFIINELPDYIYTGAQKIPINTDFRVLLHYHRLVSEDSGSGEHVLAALSMLFKDDLPDDLETAIEGINFFVAGGKEEKRQGPPKKLLGINNNIPFDFDEDDRLIWSAFYRAYGINLRTIDYMHWWEFLELLEELPDDVRLEKVIHYRTVDTNNPKISKDQKKLLQGMQNAYKIKKKKTQEDEDFAKALREGKDPNK